MRNRQLLATVGRTAAFLALLAGPAAALAHETATPHMGGFADGLWHPLTGLDHLLAMLAVGLWTAQRRQARPWALPLAFVAAMTLAATGAGMGLALPATEAGIVTSLLVLGLALALGARLPGGVALFAVACFGAVHGAAHGAEMPFSATPILYGLGFVSASVALHGAGLMAGQLAAHSGRGLILRVAGAAVASAAAVPTFG